MENNKYDQSAEFDIEGLDVFSVEREGETTIISFWVDRPYTFSSPDGPKVEKVKDDKEWHIGTTNEQHRAFVQRLTTKLTTKNNSQNSGPTA